MTSGFIITLTYNVPSYGGLYTIVICILNIENSKVALTYVTTQGNPSKWRDYFSPINFLRTEIAADDNVDMLLFVYTNVYK